jgi:hemolysin activation/secretion protein
MDPTEVNVLSASYVLPAPWERDHMLALFALWSDSNTTATGAGFQVVGKGTIFGSRYVMPLPAYEQYQHNLTVGVDYKDFKESTGFGVEAIQTPVRYVPMSFGYGASLPDEWGSTLFSAGMNVTFRGLVTDRGEFENKRFRARGNYLYATGGLERTQKLPWGLGLFLKLDGQIADQPLIANEQYSAGGMANVRGYKESEILADDAWHGIVELSGPDLAEMAGMGKWLKARPLCFYDRAELWVKDPLPGQDTAYRIHGAGLGVRGTVKEWFEYEVDWAVALSSTDATDSGTSRVHFRVKFGF